MWPCSKQVQTGPHHEAEPVATQEGKGHMSLCSTHPYRKRTASHMPVISGHLQHIQARGLRGEIAAAEAAISESSNVHSSSCDGVAANKAGLQHSTAQHSC